MKVGDKVKVKQSAGGTAFGDKTGTIIEPMAPDYEWAVEIEGMSRDSEDSYGFNESELEVI